MRTPTINGGTAPELVVPKASGTYAIVLRLDAGVEVEIGRLGRHHFPAGCYVYIGSAFGPGGLRARIRHHLRPAKRPHWHLDFLKRHAVITEVWHCSEKLGREHIWADTVGQMREVSVPVTGFGSSDCSCPAHVFHFTRAPRVRSLLRRLRADGAAHPPIKALLLSEDP